MMLIGNPLLSSDHKLLYKQLYHRHDLTWWQISDTCPNLVRMCGNLASNVCSASLLKFDDCKCMPAECNVGYTPLNKGE